MTPKNRPKLNLNRATVRSLTTAAMAGVGGGIIKTDMRGPCSYSVVFRNGICADTAATGSDTDGCPSGVYSGCEGGC